MAKHAGKTECLNYILGKLNGFPGRYAVTSIGIDGENTDQVSQIAKPEITLYEGMFFVTSEKHFNEKRLLAEILDVSDDRTSLGRLITARAITAGKVILSGPADTTSIRQCISALKRWAVDTTLVDGALSRLSLGSPAVTDAMILATGASVSRNIAELVKRTKYVYDLIRIEAVEEAQKTLLEDFDNGVWAIDGEGRVRDLDIPSLLLWEQHKENLFRYGTTLYVAGIVSDRFLQFLRMQKQINETVLIVKDFTRIFASQESYHAFLKKGGQIKVLWKTKLLSVCVNPVSPEGYRLDSGELENALERSLHIPVYNVRNLQ